MLKKLISGFMQSRKEIHNWVLTNRVALRGVCIYMFLVVTLTAVIIAGTVRSNLKLYQESFGKLQTQAYNMHAYYLDTVLAEEQQTARVHSRSLRDEIIKKVEAKYAGNSSRLLADFIKYDNAVQEQNDLHDILSHTSYDYLDKWYPGKYSTRVIIAGPQRVLFSSNYREPLRYLNKVPENIFTYNQGNIMVMDNITGNTWETTIKSLPKDPDELANISLLAISYIYEHDDLFGVHNINPDGTVADNHKLAVIVSYTPMNSDQAKIIKGHLDDLHQYESTLCARVLSGGLAWLIVLVACGIFLGTLIYYIDISDEYQDK